MVSKHYAYTKSNGDYMCRYNSHGVITSKIQPRRFVKYFGSIILIKQWVSMIYINYINFLRWSGKMIYIYMILIRGQP